MIITLFVCFIALVVGFYGGIIFSRSPLDDGPWELFHDRNGKLIGVISNDFDADVVLTVDGDFESDNHMLEYCEWLCDALNATGEHDDEC